LKASHEQQKSIQLKEEELNAAAIQAGEEKRTMEEQKNGLLQIEVEKEKVEREKQERLKEKKVSSTRHFRTPRRGHQKEFLIFGHRIKRRNFVAKTESYGAVLYTQRRGKRCWRIYQLEGVL